MNAENNNQTDKYRFVGEWVPLADVCDLLNGFAFKSKLYTNDGIRIIRIANVQKGYLDDSTPCFYPWNLEKSIEKYLLEKDDLLISLTGNVGRVALVEESFLPAALNQRVACLRIKNKSYLRKRYLYHLLNSTPFEDECIKSANGIAQKNLSTVWLGNHLIPVPSLSVQDAVVKKLDSIQLQLANAQKSINCLDSLVKSRFVGMFENRGYPRIS
ncbi:restriction endonuclease subunit S, partial [Adlercreutzia caecimuris]